MASSKPRRRQSILKRDMDGRVLYDERGRTIVDRTITARPGHFKRPASSTSGTCVARAMTDEERRRYGEVEPLSAEDRLKIGRAALCRTHDERWIHGY